MAALERQCQDLKADKFRLLMDIDDMKQDYEHSVLSSHQSATHSGNSV